MASVADLRHAGLALATSLAATVNLLLLGFAFRRRLGALGGSEILLSLLRSVAASLAMIPAVRYVAGLTDWSQRGALLVHAAVLALALAVGVAVFATVALVLGGDEVRTLTRMLRQRFVRPAP